MYIVQCTYLLVHFLSSMATHLTLLWNPRIAKLAPLAYVHYLFSLKIPASINFSRTINFDLFLDCIRIRLFFSLTAFIFESMRFFPLTMLFTLKVHIFWEGYKILRNLHQLLAVHRTNNWWRFHKILWPSENIWTLMINFKNYCKFFNLIFESDLQNTIFKKIWKFLNLIIKSDLQNTIFKKNL